MDKIDKLTEAIAQNTTKTALVSQSVGELSRHVVDLRYDVREVRDRLTTVETRLDERTAKITMFPRPINGNKKYYAGIGSLLAAIAGAVAYIIANL